MARQFIPPTELTFDAYKTSLKTFLRSQVQYADYDFEGSNFAVLIDLLAYNAWNQAVYLNMVGSESFLDSAQTRAAIVSRAKELNYLPRSAVSSRVDLSVEVVPNDSPVSITIPKYYQFKSTSQNSNTLRFITDQDIVIQKDANNRYISETFQAYEGVVVTETFVVEAPNVASGITTYNQRFDLQSANIDTSSIEVDVAIDENDTSPVTYSRATNLYGLTADSEVYFIRGFSDNYFEIEFGDGLLGKAVVAGNIVTVRYRDTIGSEGNGSYQLTKSGSIDGYSNITVTTLSRASAGADREENDEIKYNATKHFQTQDRAVIAEDYKTLIRNNFPEVQKANVYGGEEIFQYGKVIIVLKPFGTIATVTDSTKSRIVEFLKTKTLVPEPVIENPEYFYLHVDADVFYNRNATLQTTSQVTSDIVNALVDLNDTVLNDFDIDIFQNTITDAIKESNEAITGAGVEFAICRRWAPDVGVLTDYTFTIDNEIKQSMNGAYSNTSSYGVVTSTFETILNDQIEDVVIKDDGIGNLFYYVVNEDASLTKYSPAIGSVDYTDGTITIQVDVYSYSPYIRFTCKPVNPTINVTRNKFMLIDSADITVSLSA